MHTELLRYGLSRTRQRSEVYYLIGAIGPCRPRALVEPLGQRGVSKRTVYRTVRLFINTRIIRELPAGLVELQPPFRHQHYSIVCTGCGRSTIL